MGVQLSETMTDPMCREQPRVSHSKKRRRCMGTMVPCAEADGDLTTHNISVPRRRIVKWSDRARRWVLKFWQKKPLNTEGETYAHIYVSVIQTSLKSRRDKCSEDRHTFSSVWRSWERKTWVEIRTTYVYLFPVLWIFPVFLLTFVCRL